MPDIPVSVSVTGARRLHQLSRDLRGAANGGLRREFRKQLRTAANPAVADVKRAVRGSDPESTSGGKAAPDRSTGLREAVAKATTVSITQKGMRIQVSGRRLSRTHPAKLAKYLDGSLGRYKRWRRPIFGDWERGKGQHPDPREMRGDPFFFTTIRRHIPALRRAGMKAMDEVAQKIARGNRST